MSVNSGPSHGGRRLKRQHTSVNPLNRSRSSSASFLSSDYSGEDENVNDSQRVIMEPARPDLVDVEAVPCPFSMATIRNYGRFNRRYAAFQPSTVEVRGIPAWSLTTSSEPESRADECELATALPGQRVSRFLPRWTPELCEDEDSIFEAEHEFQVCGGGNVAHPSLLQPTPRYPEPVAQTPESPILRAQHRPNFHLLPGIPATRAPIVQHAPSNIGLELATAMAAPQHVADIPEEDVGRALDEEQTQAIAQIMARANAVIEAPAVARHRRPSLMGCLDRVSQKLQLPRTRSASEGQRPQTPSPKRASTLANPPGQRSEEEWLVAVLRPMDPWYFAPGDCVQSPTRETGLVVRNP